MTDKSVPEKLMAAVAAVDRAAEAVLSMRSLDERTLWQKLFPKRSERRQRHRVRRFIGTLDGVRAAEPHLLPPEALSQIRKRVEAVLGRLEDDIRARRPGPREGAMMATIIYKTTERFEGILTAVERGKHPQPKPGHLAPGDLQR